MTMDEEDISKMVKVRIHLEGLLRDAQSKAEEGKLSIASINTILAKCCNHCWIDDEIELFKGLKSHLMKVRFCSICDLTESQIAEM